MDPFELYTIRKNRMLFSWEYPNSLPKADFGASPGGSRWEAWHCLVSACLNALVINFNCSKRYFRYTKISEVNHLHLFRDFHEDFVSIAGMNIFITSLAKAKEVKFLVALVCLFVCLSVDNITQKVMNGLG